jgi:leader peptidase (prepilin peptidase)/N-methyltransferase
LLISKKKKRKDSISFGPSILLGTIIAIGLSGI